MPLAVELLLLLPLLSLCCAAASPRRDRTLKRFLRYTAINTASDAKSEARPTTPGQTRFADLLAAELRELGVRDVRVSPRGYVYATVPESPGFVGKNLPVLGFLAHLDTAPLLGKEPIKPVVHRKYAGGDLVLPGDRTQVISPKEHPALTAKIGCDIVTSDGRTILGADDKAGVAEIMTLVETLIHERPFPHGPVKIAFTPDEETGLGMEGFETRKWGADFAFTIDSEQLGELNLETFNAASAVVTFTGRNCHPGYAKGLMVNALYAAARFVAGLPRKQRPEAVSGHQGYQHPCALSGGEESATIELLLRDFTLKGLETRRKRIHALAERTAATFPGITCSVKVEERYRNMKQIIEPHAFLIAVAEEAMRDAGVTPVRLPVRGGTDGARLSFKGIPCPNLFCGSQNVHARTEWVAAEDMAKAVDTLLHLVKRWPHACATASSTRKVRRR